MEPESITVQLSANILKNAMGVGIPGTGMIGLPIAVALGALIGEVGIRARGAQGLFRRSGSSRTRYDRGRKNQDIAQREYR